MSTEIRRTIGLAAPASRSDEWRFAGACTTQAPDAFFTDRKKALAENRTLCLSCPVIAECLTVTLAQENGRYRWGVHGGLTPLQRLALDWEERLHGHRPDVETALLLTAPEWRSALHGVSRLTPDAAVRKLRKAGVDANPATVRLALWWTGKPGSRAGQRVSRQEPESDRLVRQHSDAIRELRAIGASHHDVAAYLGAPEPLVGRAVARLEKADREALETADMEMAA